MINDHILIYDLTKLSIKKKLIPNSTSLNCISIHKSGEHLITGT